MAEWSALKSKDAFRGQDAIVVHGDPGRGDPDVDLCRRFCEQRGFGGFVIWGGAAFFKGHTPERLHGECFANRWGGTLHIAPARPAAQGAPAPTVCQQPDLLEPLQARYQELSRRLRKETPDFGLAPQFSADQVSCATEWLSDLRRGAEARIESFKAQSLEAMSDLALEEWKARGPKVSDDLLLMMVRMEQAASGSPSAASLPQCDYPRVLQGGAAAESKAELEYLSRVVQDLGLIVEVELGQSLSSGSSAAAASKELVFAILRSLAQPWAFEVRQGEPSAAIQEALALGPEDASGGSVEGALEALARAAEDVAKACRGDLEARRHWARRTSERQRALARFGDELVGAARALRRHALLRIDEFDKGKLDGLVTHEEAEEARALSIAFNENVRSQLQERSRRVAREDDGHAQGDRHLHDEECWWDPVEPSAPPLELGEHTQEG